MFFIGKPLLGRLSFILSLGYYKATDNLLLYRNLIPLYHEQLRTISIGIVDFAIRDTFKFDMVYR